MEKRDYRKAEMMWKTYCREQITKAGDWINLAACLKAQGKTNQACRTIKEAIKIEPKKMLSYHSLSQCQSELGQENAAQKTLGHIIANQKPSEMTIQEMINVQFNGNAYNLANSQILESIVNEWEENIRTSAPTNIWGDESEYTMTISCQI